MKIVSGVMALLVATCLTMLTVACGGGEEEGIVATSEGGSAEEIAYIAEALSILGSLTDVFDNGAALAHEAGEDPSVLFGETWFRDLNREQRRINEIQSKVVSLNPPPRFAQSHSLLSQAIAETDAAFDLLEVGARNLNVDQLAEGLEHIREASRLLEVATDALPGQ